MTNEELSLMELAAFFKIPLYKLLNEMPYEEYLMWIEYFLIRPPGVQEDYRAAMLVAAMTPKAPLEKLFPSLGARKPLTVKESGLFSFMMNAKGGDVIGA